MKIVVVSLDNWGYNNYIVKELETYEGIEVHHIDFNLFRYQYPTIFHRVLNFFLKTIFGFNIKRNHLDNVIIERIEKLGYQDKILIIKADFLSIKTIRKLKENTSELISFYNDNIKRCPRIKKVHKYFDTNYSFERKDAEKYGFNFIANYIYQEYLDEKPQKYKVSKFEVFNISSLGKRNIIIENIALALDAIHVKYKIILAGNKEYRPKGNITHFLEKINIQEVNQYIAQSSTLLDVQRKDQFGLTFRVMDSLAYQKKLISTNADIVNYDFYNPDNILYVNPENVKIPPSFFEKKYKKIPAAILEKYTLKFWVKEVFNLEKM